MPVFFDPAMADRSDAGFIREGKVDEALQRLVPGAYLSKGHYTYPSRSELRDLVWNHMDQNHRPYIHRTYGDASRFFTDQHASFSITRFGRWPVILPIFDGYFKENGFYQVIVIFGLIALVNVIECKATDNDAQMEVNWTIASHRWLRFLHPILHRRLRKLNEVQNLEDDPIRNRRIALRAAGYRFKTDDPDFVNSNVINNNTVYPPITESSTIALNALPESTAVEVPIANRSFILKREGSTVEVWPGVCPHEGAELKPTNITGQSVKCPWHGLEFGARRLVEGTPSLTICGARLQITNGTIVVEPSVRHT